MQVYSKTISAFINKSELYLKEIMTNEAGLKVKRTRFEFNGYLYPIQISCIEDKNIIGAFEPSQFCILLNKNLMFQAKEHTLKNILRHELAHYIAFLKYGSDIAHHGQEYQEICKSYKWDKEVSSAKINLKLELEQTEGDLDFEKIYNKVSKLLTLADSSNEHEAKLATAKANDILLKYNLEKISQSNKDHEEIEYFIKPLFTAKKRTAIMLALYQVLPHFYVRPVFSHTKQGITLEITGTKANVEIAQYISTYLSNEFERLYKNNVSQKSATKKNSFMQGLAKGFVGHLNQQKLNLDQTQTTALIKVEQKLDEVVDLAYRRLSHSSTQRKHDLKSEQEGRKLGKNIRVSQGVNHDKKRKKLLRFFD